MWCKSSYLKLETFIIGPKMSWLCNTIVIIVYFKIYCASRISIFLAQNSNKEKYKRKVAKLKKIYMENWDYLSNRPFITIAEDLLKCLKENLIEEIVFGLASWTKRKQNFPSVLNKVRIDEFNESFKKFSNKCFFINDDNKEIKDY